MVKLPNHLGDLVMAVPTLAVARAACPEARLSVLVRESLAPTLKIVPWVDDVAVHPWPVGLDPRRHREIGASLASRREQGILLLTRSLESAAWAALARIPERCGQPAEGRSPLLTHRLKIGHSPSESCSSRRRAAMRSAGGWTRSVDRPACR
jgi:ADP-heptose:LPS heptosyltransferase